MKEIDFLILYELPERELENILLIVYELKKRNFKVAYERIPSPNIFKLRHKYFNKVGTIIVPFMYSNHEIYTEVYSIAGKVDRIVNLQWEQVRTNEVEKDVNSFGYPKQYAKNVIHLCWGKIPQNNLISAGVKEEFTFVSGPLQMDFLRDEFHDYYLSRSELFNKYNIDTEKKVILFISSFSYAQLDEDQIKDLNEKLGNENVSVFQKLSLESQKGVTEWIKRFLDKHKDIIFIYRPHPAERTNSLIIEVQDSYKNFKIIESNSVKQWIVTVDKVYTWYSTSFAEAYFADKECSILRPTEIPYNKEVAILNGIEKIDNYSSFEKSINDNERQKKIESLYNYYDFGQLSTYLRISDFLEAIHINNKYNFIWDNNISSYCRKKSFRYKRYEFNSVLVPYIAKLIMNFNLSNFFKDNMKVTNLIAEHNNNLKLLGICEEREKNVMQKLKKIIN